MEVELRHGCRYAVRTFLQWGFEQENLWSRLRGQADEAVDGARTGEAVLRLSRKERKFDNAGRLLRASFLT